LLPTFPASWLPLLPYIALEQSRPEAQKILDAA
jgi:hypothetical protein